MTEDKVFFSKEANSWKVACLFWHCPFREGWERSGGVNHCLKVSGNCFQVQVDNFMIFEGGGGFPFQGGFSLLIYKNQIVVRKILPYRFHDPVGILFLVGVWLIALFFLAKRDSTNFADSQIRKIKFWSLPSYTYWHITHYGSFRFEREFLWAKISAN